MGAYGDGSKPYLRKDGYWVSSFATGYTERGTRRRRYVTATTEAECKRRHRDALRDYRATGAVALDPRMTVKRWCDEWLTWYQTHAKPATYVGDSGNISRWIVPTIGNRQLAALTVADVRRVETAVMEGGRSATTASNVSRLLRRVLKAAIAGGYRVPEPVMLAGLASPAVSRRDAMPAASAAHLLATAIARPWGALPPRPKDAQGEVLWREDRLMRDVDPSRWLAALLQGLRQGEALGLRWEMIDLERGVMEISWQLQRIPAGAVIPSRVEAVHLHGCYYLTRPKTSSGRRVLPIIPVMGDALRRWREVCPTPDGLVWPRWSGTPMRASDDLSAWKALQRVAGVSKLGQPYLLHEARHTTASLLTLLGVPEPVIIAIVGHSSIASTQRYRHVDLAQSREALAAVADLLGLRLVSLPVNADGSLGAPSLQELGEAPALDGIQGRNYERVVASD